MKEQVVCLHFKQTAVHIHSRRTTCSIHKDFDIILITLPPYWNLNWEQETYFWLSSGVSTTALMVLANDKTISLFTGTCLWPVNVSLDLVIPPKTTQRMWELDLEFCSFHFPLRSLHLEARPFCLQEVQNSGHRILWAGRLFFLGFTSTDTHPYWPRSVLSKELRSRPVFGHHSLDFMAAITILRVGGASVVDVMKNLPFSANKPKFY